MNCNINDLKVDKKISIKEAMKQLGETSEGILFVVDSKNRLFGSLTSGDIRRWILSKGSIKDHVSEACNKKSMYVEDGSYNIETVKEAVISNRLEAVPVLDDKRLIIDILFRNDLFDKRHKQQKKKVSLPVVIMAGGRGERMDPFTKILPKPLIPLGEKPAVELVMDHFHENGCADFFLTLGYKGEMVKSYFDNSKISYKIKYIWEKKPLGTAGALKLLHNQLPQTFFVSNCDIIIKADYSDIYNFHVNNKNVITIIASLKHFVIPYGIIELSHKNLKKITEKPEYEFLVNTGMYLIENKAVELIPRSKRFDMTDLIKKAKNKKQKVGIYPISEKAWMDIGEWEKYKETIKKFEL